MDLPACSALAGDFPVTTAAKMRDASSGRIVLVDNAGDLAVVEPGGENLRSLTSDAFVDRAGGRMRTYRFPAPSPDGSALAFVRVDVDDEGVRQTVQVASLNGQAAVREIEVVRGLNVPYIDWSPNGALLAYLAISGPEGEIRVAPVAGGEPQSVQRGVPAYWNWRPDVSGMQAMLAHVGGRAQDAEDGAAVTRIELDDGAARATPLAVLPGQFQSPHYSPDGRHTLYAVNTGPTDLLVVGDADGTPRCALTRLDRGAFFAWSPDGVHVAMIDVVAPASQTAPVRVFDVRDGSSRTVHRDALMFFWSPDGAQLAVLSAIEADGATRISAPAAQQPQLLMRVEVVDVTGARSQRIADLHPTVSIVQYVQYFDQYSRVVTPWSPDSRSLVFAGAEESGGPAVVVVANFDAQGEFTVLRRVADGTLAFFAHR